MEHGLTIEGADGQTWEATLAPELSSFAIVREHVVGLRDTLASDVTTRVLLACDETFSNIVSYSGTSAVWLEITQRRGRVIVRISDDGIPFDPLSLDEEEHTFEDLEFGGMGISFIRQSCDNIAYAYEDGKNVLTMTFEDR